jgi:RNA polymerase sigma-70 factor (ECF subfamily)
MSLSQENVFEDLNNNEYQKFIHYAMGITHSEEMAKDVVQEALRIGFEKSHQIRDPSCAFSWLITIIRHEAYKQLHFSHREMFLPLDDNKLVGLDGVGTERHIVQMYTSDLIKQTLAQFPRDYSQIMHMRYAHNYTFSQIAKYVHMNTDTVRSIHNRIIKKMRVNAQGFYE